MTIEEYAAECKANGESQTNIDLLAIHRFGKKYEDLDDEQATAVFDDYPDGLEEIRRHEATEEVN